MLRAEQQAALNGFQMGQWSSKVESVDTPPSMSGVASNGHVNGTNGRAQHSPRPNLTFLRSPEPEFSIKGSSKRTLDDRDMDDQETNGDYRLDFSRKDVTQPTPDRYSTQGHSGSVSPVDLRHTFVPERTDQWSPNKRQQYRRELSGSSNPAHRQGRTDQWMPELASSPRNSSPPPRPPLGPRANSTLSNSQSRFGSKPPIGERRGSESIDRARYTSLTWTAPGLKSKQINNNSAQRTSAATIESPSPMDAPKDHIAESIAAEKVIVNGVKGVPTGPKSERARLGALEANKGRPFIFISRRFLTPQAATVPHLHKFLRKYIKDRSDIVLADMGFHLYFDNTEDGLGRLDQCYWAKNRQLLFGQYVLEMVCYHDGVSNTTPNTSINTHSRPATIDVPSANQTSEMPEQQRAAVGHVTSSIPTPPQGHQGATTADPGLQSRNLERATSMTIEPSAASAPPVLRHSSPLRVPSRQDRDDSSSSISGFTGSDLSASRAHKCHVCEYPPWSDSEPLVQCSSCPRRYHRRCNKEPLPTDPELQHTWQCRRCIRKNVQLKSTLSNTYFASTSPAPSVGQPEEPPAKRPRLTHTAPNPAFVAATTLSNGVPEQDPELHLDETTMDPVTLVSPEIPEIETLVDLARQVNSDELRISEVDDLVERSFTSFVETKKPEEKTKLILHVKKKNTANSKQDTSIENDECNESNSAPSGGPVKLSHPHHQDMEANDKANKPKRERHKWNGRGADKDIVQAGMQSFFSEKSVDEERTPTTQNGNHGEQLPSSATGARVEISDSPEYSRSVNNVNGSINESDGRHFDAQSSPKKRLKIIPPKPSESQAMKAYKPQTGPTQRMKPGRISADKCRTCGRTIAFNPAGPKMCSGCKKEAATAEPSMPSAGEALTEEHIVKQDVPPAGLTAAEKIEKDIGALLNSSGPEEEGEDEDEEDTEGSRPKSPRSVTNGEPVLESLKSKRPCDSCRSRHKRCIHRTDEAVTGGDHEDVVEDDTARDDLDFWNAAPGQDSTGTLGNSTFDDEDAPITHASNTTAANRDRSSSLSPAPDDVPALPTKIKKRISHARPATSEYDLGDSRERPPNTYKKLIGMALCSAPDYRMKASEIVHWIADNIPGYGLGEGTKWEGGISATLSMNREKDDNIGLWRKIEIDGAKKNDPCWYQLQPGQEYEMLHWDAVLKQPVSPMKRRDEKGSSKRSDRPMENYSTHNHSFEQQQADASGSPTQVRQRRLKLNAGKIPSIPRKHAPTSVDDSGKISQSKYHNTAFSNIDINELQAQDPADNRDADSSDEEPIATSRKKRPMAPKHVAQANVPDFERKNDARSRDAFHRITESSEGNVSRTPAKLSIMRQFTLPSHSAAVDKKVVAQLIKEDAENVDYSAQSLFKEWPELDPANEFNREAKIEEIRRRPTRKQKFGIRSHEMFAAPQTSYSDINSYAPPKLNRSMRDIEDDFFAWQTNDDVKHFDSLEEMFDLPLPRSSILQEGQIAYRDGPKTEFDGTRRRAKKIYPTGYAKHH